MMGHFSLRHSVQTLGPTQQPIDYVSGIIFPGIKRPEPETDHSLPTSADVKNTSQYVSAALFLVKRRDNF
jgi:hypothetical protein